jgi:hypothetical protein
MTDTTTAAPTPLTLEGIYREVTQLRERLEDLEDREDLRELRAAKARQAGQPTVPWDQVKIDLGLD